MKRKINRVGTNTLTVSLPSKWAREMGLKAGDEINLLENGRELVLNSHKTAALGSITVDVSDQDVFRGWMVYVPYRLGYDEIKILFRSSDHLKQLYHYLPSLIGFEIIEQGEKFCILKNIAVGIEEEFDSMYQRLVNVTISMGLELFGLLKEGRYEKIEGCILIEKQANKLDLFCRRMLNLRGYRDPKKTSSKYRIVCLLEEITDQYRNIGMYILGSYGSTHLRRRRVSEQVLHFFLKIYELVQYTVRLTENHTPHELTMFKTKMSLLEKEMVGLLNNNAEKDKAIVLFLSQILYSTHNIIEEIY